MILQTLFGFNNNGLPKVKPAAQASTRVARDTSPRETNLAGRILGKLTFNPITKFLFTPVQKQINERAIARGTLPTRPVLERQNRVEGFRRVFRHVESPILDLGGRVVNVIRENAAPLDVLAGLIGGGAVVAKKAPQTVGSVLPRKFRPKVSTSGPVSSLDELERTMGFTAEERAKFARMRKDVDELFRAEQGDAAFPRRGRSPIDEDELDELQRLFDTFDDDAVAEIGDIIFQGPGSTNAADASAAFARSKLPKPSDLGKLDLSNIDDSALLDQLIERVQGRPADLEIIFRELGKRRN